MPAPILASDDMPEVAALYRDGLAVREIAKRYGVAPSTVSRRLGRAGVQKRPASRRRVRTVKPPLWKRHRNATERRAAMTPAQRAGMRELERLLAAGIRLDVPTADVVSGALRAVWDRAEDGMEVGA